MPSYPLAIRCCHHIKVNGTQCGSPALREEQYCYFHMRWHASRMSALRKERQRWTAALPTLEDANSIQVGLAEVMRLLVTREVDHKTASLLLYAMQTASVNMKRTSFEPEPTLVVIDRECVKERPLGATAWSKVEGREYDDLEKADSAQADSGKDAVGPAVDAEEAERSRRFGEDYNFLVEGLARDPKFLDQRGGDFRAKPKGTSSSAGLGAARTTEGL